MFTVSNLLEQLPKEGSLETKKLEKLFKLTKKADKLKLDIALKGLTKLGLLEIESDLVSLNKKNEFIEARLRCSSKGYCFAIRDDENEDIYIRDQYLNHAWHGDRVLVKINREGIRRRSPEGAVQCILERKTKNLLCLIERDDENNIIGLPLDDRIIATINLKDEDQEYITNENKDNLVEVRIEKYPIAQFCAEGYVVRKLDLNGDREADIDLILKKINISDTGLPSRANLKTPTDKYRKDLTSQETLIFSNGISSNSPCLPALYIEQIGTGYKLWLHSPSIAERISIGGNLDNWLKSRGEAICLGQRWEPLLNESLAKTSEFIVGEDNEAISLRMDINKEGTVTGWEFALSKIKPIAKVNQEHLVSLAERKPRSRVIPTKLKDIKSYLSQLKSLIECSKILHSKETSAGFIELDLPSPKIDEIGDLQSEQIGEGFYQWKLPFNQRSLNSILSSIIRLSNLIWFNHSNHLELPSIIITANQIDNSNLNDVAKSALALDIELELDEEGSPSASELAKAFSQTESRRILDKLLKHALPDNYLRLSEPRKNNNDSNYDILTDKQSNIEINPSSRNSAPWTCPSLHYIDIVNQFILVSLLKEAKASQSSRSKNKINLGESCNLNKISWDLFNESTIKIFDEIFNSSKTNEYNIKRLQSKALRNALIAIAQARAAEPFVGKNLEAVITGVQSYGFFAEIEESKAEGLVHVSSLNDDWYEYRSRQNRLVGRKNKKVYQIGDNLIVRLVNVDILRNQVDLEVVDTTDSSNTEETISSNPVPVFISED